MDKVIKPVRVIKRGKSYQLYYTNPDGLRRRISVGPDEAQAQRMAVKFTDWLLEGKDPEQEIAQAAHASQAKSITLKEFFPTFMDKHGCRQSKSMQTLYGFMFKNICRCSKLADTAIGKLTQSVVSDYMDLRIRNDGVKPSTVNREATFIRTMLGLATRRGILDKNPMQGFKLYKESSKREVQIKPEDIGRLIETLPDAVGDIVRFAVYTGIRKENILDLGVEQVSLHDIGQTGEVKLFVKGGRWEIKPLKKEAVEVLRKAIGNRSEGYVFINPSTGTRYDRNLVTFKRAVDKLGLKTVSGANLCFHDLRRIFATWMLESGVGIEAVQYFLGHKSILTTTRYTSYNGKKMGELLSQLPAIPVGVKKKVSAG